MAESKRKRDDDDDVTMYSAIVQKERKRGK